MPLNNTNEKCLNYDCSSDLCLWRSFTINIIAKPKVETHKGKNHGKYISQPVHIRKIKYYKSLRKAMLN